MTMFTAPTREQYRSAHQLLRGQFSLQFEQVVKLLNSELNSTIDKLVNNRDVSDMTRLQGRATVLKDLLAFIESSKNHSD